MRIKHSIKCTLAFGLSFTKWVWSLFRIFKNRKKGNLSVIKAKRKEKSKTKMKIKTLINPILLWSWVE